MTGKHPKLCPICQGKANSLVSEPFALYACAGCGVHFRQIGQGHAQDHFVQVDLASYSRSVQVVRERSYQKLVEAVRPHAPDGRWLDVGCSFGWLLRYVQSRGFDPHGVEPSPSAASAAQASGLPVEMGLYPDKDGGKAPYQVISFMDVLEHLPNPLPSLEAARRHLTSDGVLVAQVPDRECLMYRTALLMARASGNRLGGPLRRLYLDGLDFPHVYYHSRRSLGRLLEQSGFAILQAYYTPIGSLDTSVDRVAYLKKPGQRTTTVWILALGVGLLQVLDNCRGHGGLLTMLGKKI